MGKVAKPDGVIWMALNFLKRILLNLPQGHPIPTFPIQGRSVGRGHSLLVAVKDMQGELNKCCAFPRMGREKAEAGMLLSKSVLILIKVKQIPRLPWKGKVAKPDGVI